MSMPKPKMVNPKDNSPSSTTTVSSWVEWFNRAAKHYDDPLMKMAYITDGQSGQPIAETIMQATYDDMWQKLNAHQDHTVLDVGCGVGFFAKTYANNVGRMIGTDVAFQMLCDAHRLNPDNAFFVAQADKLPFRSASFDRILCYSVFHYLENKVTARKVLDEFTRIVKKGGRILIGDILEHHEKPQKNIGEQQSGSNHRWWPSILDHDLTKLTFTRDFFTDYCNVHHFECDILEQNIAGRDLPSPRFDVALTP